MKKIIFLCIVLGLGYAFLQDMQANNEPGEYMTAESSSERVAEEIIRDVWGARSRRAGEEKPVTRVISIKSIPQVDGTIALDMRIQHFVLSKKNDGKNCTYWVHGGILSKIKWLNM